MKRPNPITKQPFKKGDEREEDGFIFDSYKLNHPVKKNGYYQESWYSPEVFERRKQNKTGINRNYYKTNMDKIKAANSEYGKNNRDKKNASEAKRRVKKLHAGAKYKPKGTSIAWENMRRFARMLTKILGTQMHVDHIIPLQHDEKKVSGLDIPANWQIIPASVNCRKSNKFDCDKYKHQLPIGYKA